MAEALFPLLLALTLLDLGFVHACDVVAGTELLPLWLLAAGSPWLRRLQRFTAYRALWNLGVLLVFALLVRHATTTGLLHMLEDGLLLAILCQVHLINNIGARQRPDLVFFNSLLITFVTSFFAPDLSWSGLFAAHAMVLVPSLQVYAIARRQPDLDGRSLRRILRDSLPRTAVVGVVTALAFVLVPRDFRREGWLGEALALSGQAASGPTERIQLDDERASRLDNRVVMQLRPSSGEAADVPSHWRQIAFVRFTGASWLPQEAGELGGRLATDPAWQIDRTGGWSRVLPVPRQEPPAVAVRLQDRDAHRLPCPLEAQGLRLAAHAGMVMDPRPDGILGVLRTAETAGDAIGYEVRLALAPGQVRPTARLLQVMTALPERGVPDVVRDLAVRLRAQQPADADLRALAEASRDWLQEHRRYQLPGEPGFARNLGDFLIGSGAGHCEYFATALALLLRLQNVPCRLVGGYLAHEWDANAHEVVVRSRHAHAWVEALLPDGSWLLLDATPAADVIAAGTPATTWWQSVHQDLAAWWNRIVGFDGEARSAWLGQLARLPLDLARAAWQNPLPTALGAAALAGLVLLRRRRGQHQPDIAALRRAVAAAGLRLLPGETPRELLRRAAGIELPPARRTALERAAAAHERARYAPSPRQDSSACPADDAGRLAPADDNVGSPARGGTIP